MRKLAAGLAALALTVGIVPILAAPTATADKVCDYGTPAYNNVGCYYCEKENGMNMEAIKANCQDWWRTSATPPRQTQAPPSTMPVQTPEVKPPPSVVPVQTPKINPPGPGAPKNAALVKPPKGMDAPPEAVAAAKSAPASRVDPANPPKPLSQADFNQQVQNVVSAHGDNVDIVHADNQALVRPRHWDWIDYDADHHPTLYNPLTEGMTFRYFYDGAYRQVYVAAGSRVVLDMATGGVFPFTAVGDNYVASGSFYGGSATPQVYQDVSANVPAANQTVQLGQVTVMGHDDSLPVGSQDAFVLDDSTLAWGQVNDTGSGAQITVAKTQPMPGLGPMDNGGFLVALAAHEQPTDNTWWLWPLGGAVLVIAAGLMTWVVIRRKRNAEVTPSA